VQSIREAKNPGSNKYTYRTHIKIYRERERESEKEKKTINHTKYIDNLQKVI
jgi:hypothetical protein